MHHLEMAMLHVITDLQREYGIIVKPLIISDVSKGFGKLELSI